jgi:hypothetical protein
LVIVVSILLAFGVQASWEEYQERRAESEYLVALRGELDQTRSVIANQRDVTSSVLRAHESLLEQFNTRSYASSDSLLVWLSHLSRPVDFRPPVAVLDDIVSSGGIQLIRVDSLRLAIAEYERSLELVDRNSQQAWATWSDRIQPYLEARVPRVNRLALGSFGTAVGNDVPFGPGPFESKYQEIFTDPGFQSMIAERWFRVRAANSAREALEPMIERLIVMIDGEVT